MDLQRFLLCFLIGLIEYSCIADQNHLKELRSGIEDLFTFGTALSDTLLQRNAVVSPIEDIVLLSTDSLPKDHKNYCETLVFGEVAFSLGYEKP